MIRPITTLIGVNMDGTCKLVDNNLLLSNGESVNFPNSSSTLATSSDISTLNTTLSNLATDVETLETRVDGANPALVFDTESAMNTFLSNSSNTATLKTGQNLYIRELNVPDYWWDGENIQKLETEKVNLNNYVSLDGTQTLTNKTLTTPQISSIKNSTYTLTIPTKTGTLATTSDIPSDYVKTSGTQTIAGVKTFSSAPKLNTNSLTTSSNYTISLPNTANATISTTSGTETLTNKTLTAPTITNPIIKMGSNTLTLPSSGTLATTSDIAAASTGGSLTDELNLQSQILYLSTRLETALNYLSEKPYYPRIKTICDEVCAVASINKAS